MVYKPNTVTEEEVIAAIKLLDDCIGHKCLGQGDGQAVITLIKAVAHGSPGVAQAIYDTEHVYGAVENGYTDA